MKGSFTYDNFCQADYFVDGEWKEGILHGEWFITLDGEAHKLDNIDDDLIHETVWKKLKKV